jgi:methyltransferase-like protein 6
MPVSEFWKAKYELEAAKNWNLFYKRHETRFFKDRHWTIREFDFLKTEELDRNLVFFEVGCGVGNFLFPLFRELPCIFAYACDVSTYAIQLFKVGMLTTVMTICIQ